MTLLCCPLSLSCPSPPGYVRTVLATTHIIVLIHVPRRQVAWGPYALQPTLLYSSMSLAARLREDRTRYNPHYCTHPCFSPPGYVRTVLATTHIIVLFPVPPCQVTWGPYSLQPTLLYSSLSLPARLREDRTRYNPHYCTHPLSLPARLREDRTRYNPHYCTHPCPSPPGYVRTVRAITHIIVLIHVPLRQVTWGPYSLQPTLLYSSMSLAARLREDRTRYNPHYCTHPCPSLPGYVRTVRAITHIIVLILVPLRQVTWGPYAL